jgi:hypothetical protein
MRSVEPDTLVRTIRDFLNESRSAVILEDGAVIFELENAKFSISGDRGRCLLQLWSAERNIVRRVVEAELKNTVLRLSVQRLGQARPSKLEICRDRDRRTPSAKRAARCLYQQKLQRMLERHYPGFTLARLSSTRDLEHSFGPVYTRAAIKKGQSTFAVFGVNEDESQVSIDAALTFAILWLNHCRESQDNKAVVEGLKLFLPAGRSGLTRERMARLDRKVAKWQLYEFNQQEDSRKEMDCSDRGNVATRLVHRPDEQAAYARFAASIEQVRGFMCEAEIAILSPAEIAFRLHGLEFARARLAHDPTDFRSGQEIVFGIGAEERLLTTDNWADFERLMAQIGEVRHPTGPRDHALFRLHPERWVESLIVRNVRAVDERLDRTCVYSQVPAFSSSDRAMIDVLTTSVGGRLAVLELKADEDIHLPLQGLDYWSRVVWHHTRGEFQRFGYFAGRELSNESPALFLVAPALHVHPATDTLLRYISPEIDWTLVGIDERWRNGVRVIFRKRRESPPRRHGDAEKALMIAD